MSQQLDLDEIRTDLQYASDGIDGPDMPYHPHALRAMRVAEKLLAEVERLQTTLEDYRGRLVAAEADLLDVRGVLSPNGEPERTPVPLVPTVAPAVQWLAAEVQRLRAIVAAAEPTEDAVVDTAHVEALYEDIYRGGS